MEKLDKFTQASVTAWAAKSGEKEVFCWHPKISGFGVRAQNGKGSWCVQYRVGKRQRRISLKSISKVSLETAQEIARGYFGDVARKVDPAVARKKATTKASATFEDAAEDFLKYQIAKVTDTYRKATAKSLRDRFKTLHGLSLADIDRATVAVALRVIAAKSGPVMADRGRTHLMKFFNWAIGEGLCEHNPVDHTNRQSGEAREGRVLSPAEIKKIWYALPNDSFGRIMELLILTGQRRTEIGDLKWSEVDLDGDAPAIVLGGVRTKNSRKHHIPLSKAAVAVLKRCPRKEGRDFIFGGVGAAGFMGWSKAKGVLEKASKLTGWKIHDLRHTLKTWMQANGVPEDVRSAVQNHTDGDMDSLYGHYTWEKEKRDVLERYGKHITEIVGPTKSKLSVVRAA